MHDIVLIGLNHKTAPVDLRECIAFSGDEAQEALGILKSNPAIEEVILLSTCNRVEILMAAGSGDAAVAAAQAFLGDFKQVPVARHAGAFYVHRGDEAIRHVFRVAASLDSMIVGEPQILGQMKAAYLVASQQKTAGVILNRLMHRTFFVAKRIRTETGIGDHAVSISYAAIELAKKIFGSLKGKKTLLIGAGEMAELAVEHLIRNRAGAIFVANRTFERGVALAETFQGTAIRFEEIAHRLSDVDIIISSTGAPGYVVDRAQVKGAMRSRRHRPIFFIDIAVPRDVDPEINRINNAYVYDIDDLNGVIEENIEDRRREAVKGERIVDEAVIRFRQWHESLSVVPTIKALREKIETIVFAEIQKTRQALNPSGDPTEAMERMAGAMVNKILHDPTKWLKGDGCRGGRSVYLDAVRKLFNLDDDSPA
ncbi:MAG: glutamyl-tRNA reductase [Desulfobacterales bacterium]|nr:glutamyl-tRNA reductase [Desulfobacterales bacterium]